MEIKIYKPIVPDEFLKKIANQVALVRAANGHPIEDEADEAKALIDPENLPRIEYAYELWVGNKGVREEAGIIDGAPRIAPTTLLEDAEREVMERTNNDKDYPREHVARYDNAVRLDNGLITLDSGKTVYYGAEYELEYDENEIKDQAEVNKEIVIGMDDISSRVDVLEGGGESYAFTPTNPDIVPAGEIALTGTANTLQLSGTFKVATSKGIGIDEAWVELGSFNDLRLEQAFMFVQIVTPEDMLMMLAIVLDKAGRLYVTSFNQQNVFMPMGSEIPINHILKHDTGAGPRGQAHA
jgi:hypothetical protein